MNELIEDYKILKVGDTINFEEEKQKYTIQARNSRYIICTKPFNVKNTVIYTIVDLQLCIRGTLAGFSLGYETREECNIALENIEKLTVKNNQFENYTVISSRNNIKLNIKGFGLKI